MGVRALAALFPATLPRRGSLWQTTFPLLRSTPQAHWLVPATPEPRFSSPARTFHLPELFSVCAPLPHNTTLLTTCPPWAILAIPPPRPSPLHNTDSVASRVASLAPPGPCPVLPPPILPTTTGGSTPNAPHAGRWPASPNAAPSQNHAATHAATT